MGPALGHVAASKNDDSVAVVDRAQPVRDENTSAGFLFENAVDVLQQGLLRMCVERRCLFIKPISES